MSLQNVTFKYPNTDNLILDNFNYEFTSSHCYALAGLSGCGKSTIASLIIRLYELQNGAILFNGTDANSIRLPVLRKAITLSTQNDPIIQGINIQKNVCFGEAYDAQRMQKALELA